MTGGDIVKRLLALAAAFTLAGCAATGPAPAVGQSGGVVKITGLGSHDGEFCPLDRAIVFEDPDGTRILYDAGRKVHGPNDPRLGKIDAVLLTHVHGTHYGDQIQPSPNAGTTPRPASS